MKDLAAQFASALPQDQDGGSGWVGVLRRSGAQRFRLHGLPTRKDEAWKYTGLGLFGQTGTRLGIAGESFGSDVATPVVEPDLQVNVLDGCMRGLEVELPSGVSVVPLQDALDTGFSGLQTLLESLPESPRAKPSSDGFTALNSATLGAGVVIHVAAGTNAGRILLNWSTTAGDHSRFFNSRVCLMLDHGAKLDLLEQFESPKGNTNSCNIVLQAELGENAGFQHVRFQQESPSTGLITRTEVSQLADSEYAYFGFDLGGGLVRHDLHATLLGSGAKSHLNGAYLLDVKRHVDNHARIDHMAVGGFSEQFFRGVAGGSAKAVFNTAVCVHPGADETEARQSNANILLSSHAEINTKPELEIYADEVVASHGATVGQLDEIAVFYLRSRGLSESAARRMLTAAFCRAATDKLEDSGLAGRIAELIDEVMPSATSG